MENEREIARMFQTLSDENRIRILKLREAYAEADAGAAVPGEHTRRRRVQGGMTI